MLLESFGKDLTSSVGQIAKGGCESKFSGV